LETELYFSLPLWEIKKFQKEQFFYTLFPFWKERFHFTPMKNPTFFAFISKKKIFSIVQIEALSQVHYQGQ